MPYTTLSYANGPGFAVSANGSRVNLTNFDMGKFFQSNLKLDF